MRKLSFSKKLLIISPWVPPAPASPAIFLYNLFSQFDPATFFILTSAQWATSTDKESKLPCRYFSFGPRAKTGSLRSILSGLRVIRNEDIELLLGIGDRGYTLILTFVLSLLSGKPYAVYLLDLYRWNYLGSKQKILARICEPILFKYAGSIFVMGDGHRLLYERKYGNRFTYTVIRNCVEPDHQAAAAKKSAPPYRIVYTGNIYWAQEGSVRNLIKAVSLIPDMDIRIDLYSLRVPERIKNEFANNPRVAFKSALHEEMAAIQASADILFLPLAWNARSREVIEMATPGKTAEYLVSGRPILVHAPPYAFLSTYAREKGFAEVVDEENIEKLRDAVRRLLTDEKHVAELIKNAEKLSASEYDVAVNARELALHIPGGGELSRQAGAHEPPDVPSGAIYPVQTTPRA